MCPGPLGVRRVVEGSVVVAGIDLAHPTGEPGVGQAHPEVEGHLTELLPAPLRHLDEVLDQPTSELASGSGGNDGHDVLVVPQHGTVQPHGSARKQGVPAVEDEVVAPLDPDEETDDQHQREPVQFLDPMEDLHGHSHQDLLLNLFLGRIHALVDLGPDSSLEIVLDFCRSAVHEFPRKGLGCLCDPPVLDRNVERETAFAVFGTKRPYLEKYEYFLQIRCFCQFDDSLQSVNFLSCKLSISFFYCFVNPN